MNKSERQQSLINARRACVMLAEYAAGEIPTAFLTDEHREYVACLLEEFGRLDANARRVGRKRIKTNNPKTLAQRRWRDKQKQ